MLQEHLEEEKETVKVNDSDIRVEQGQRAQRQSCQTGQAWKPTTPDERSLYIIAWPDF